MKLVVKKSVQVREGTIVEVVALSQQIPEFDNAHGAEEYEKRLSEVDHLILIAEMENRPVGFKVGYQRKNDGSFYSWMGGVLPTYRKDGVAAALANAQEKWARGKGYKTIKFKTLNRHKAMLHFALKNDFNIIAVKPRTDINENRIILEKRL